MSNVMVIHLVAVPAIFFLGRFSAKVKWVYLRGRTRKVKPL